MNKENLKEVWHDTKRATAKEAYYLACKAQGFNHPAEVGDQVKIFATSRNEIKVGKKVMDAHLKAESGLIKIGKTAEEAYKSKMVGGEKIQHEKLSHVYRNFGDFIGQDSGFREELHSNLNDINQEWKDLQKGILRQTSKRNDQLNRSLTDMAYYKKFKKFDKVAYYDGKYNEQAKDFVENVHQVRMEKEKRVPEWLLRFLQAQVLYHRKALALAEKYETILRGLGPVEPMPYEIPEELKTGRSRGRDYFSEDWSTSNVETTTPTNSIGLAPPVLQYPVAPLVSPVRRSRNLPTPPQQQRVRAEAIYSYNAFTDKDLSFMCGDVLTILSQEGDWWMAELNGHADRIVVKTFITVFDFPAIHRNKISLPVYEFLCVHMADSSSDEDTLLRFVVVGEDGCGKTSLLHTYLHDEYPEGKYSSTASRLDKVRRQVGEHMLMFEDTRNNAQDDRNRLLSYPFADIVLICFDMSKKETLDSVTEKWLVEINHHCHKSPPCFLVGLKNDLDAAITMSDIQSIQSANPQCVKIFTLSSKSDTAKVKELFNDAINSAVVHKNKQKEVEESGSKKPAARSGGGGKRRGCIIL